MVAVVVGANGCGREVVSIEVVTAFYERKQERGKLSMLWQVG